MIDRKFEVFLNSKVTRRCATDTIEIAILGLGSLVSQYIRKVVWDDFSNGKLTNLADLLQIDNTQVEIFCWNRAPVRNHKMGGWEHVQFLFSWTV